MINWISVIEGLIFMVGDDGISVDQIMKVTGLNELLINEYLNDIKDHYADENRGFELVIYGGLYKFVTKANIYEFGSKLFALPEKNKLSQAALETLAIIAYKQPITRVEIEELRGVNCDAMIRKLLSKALIKESGRSDAIGKPILYSVTEEFMDKFQLASLDELPELPKLVEEENVLFGEIEENEE